MEWSDITRKAGKTGISPVLVLREEMQKATLASLSRMNAFNHIVFQGGTAIRIFYNSPRFSEDLDFVLNGDTAFDLASRAEELERYISSEFHYLQEIRVRVQKNTGDIQRIAVRSISDIPSQRLSINVELFSVPSHLNSPKILAYPPINPVVRVEAPEEILVDKIIAIALREYLKGRDIWDLYYLTNQLNVSTDRELLAKKAGDYGAEGLREKIGESREKLMKNGVEALDREMKRFLPVTAYAQLKDSFEDIVISVSEQLARCAEEMI